MRACARTHTHARTHARTHFLLKLSSFTFSLFLVNPCDVFSLSHYELSLSMFSIKFCYFCGNPGHSRLMYQSCFHLCSDALLFLQPSWVCVVDNYCIKMIIELRIIFLHWFSTLFWIMSTCVIWNRTPFHQTFQGLFEMINLKMYFSPLPMPRKT